MLHLLLILYILLFSDKTENDFPDNFRKIFMMTLPCIIESSFTMVYNSRNHVSWNVASCLHFIIEFEYASSICVS